MSIEKTAPVSVARLREDLAGAHGRSLALAEGLSSRQLSKPGPAMVNPVPWELCHMAWFQEKHVLRRAGAAAMIDDADARFDPAVVRHDARWAAAIDLDTALDYKRRVLDALQARLAGEQLAGEDAYRFQLAVIHEHMRGEALLHMRQVLGWPAPAFVAQDAGGNDAAAAAEGEDLGGGDVAVPGGVHMLGGEPGDGFLMDNEEWGHGFEVKPFQIARAAVTNAEFMAFVDDDGYGRQDLWRPQGWGWRDYAGADAPLYWERHGDGWRRRDFGRIARLDGAAAVVNVNWFEADAWCRWAGRRLPSEAEWEVAASRAPAPGADILLGPKRRYPWGDELPGAQIANLNAERAGPIHAGALAAGDSAYGCRQMIGNVWEWTNSIFVPYPGFMPGPSADYSRPWFETGRPVLRGGSWATSRRQVWNTFRYFHLPERRDIFAGFRTCAL